MNRAIAIATALALTFALVQPAVGQDFDLSWWSIDCGGALLTAGGNFELSGTFGQTDAGIMSGGSFTLSGGFWPGVTPPCIGDLDNDGAIGLGDLAILLSHFGQPSGASPGDGDSDSDGDVDLGDLAQLLAVFGTSCP
jgi:hypothetical protein